jgi:hypothetical protein
MAISPRVSGTTVVQLSEGPPLSVVNWAAPGFPDDIRRLPLPCTLQTLGQCRVLPVIRGGPPVIRHVWVWSSW